MSYLLVSLALEIFENDGTFFFTHQEASTITPVLGMEFRRLTEPDAGVDEVIIEELPLFFVVI